MTSFLCATMSALLDNGQGNGKFLFVLEFYPGFPSGIGLIFAAEKVKDSDRETQKVKKKDTHTIERLPAGNRERYIRYY